VLVEAAAELGPQAGDHDLEIDADHTAIVDGARDELLRLAQNLMENALKHTPPGTAVRAEVNRFGDEVVLRVEDEGPGVPPELRGRLFERFVRGGGDRGGSFGLGLSIVRAVAESHGGSVVLEDPPGGRGAAFVVRLPAALDLDDDGQDHRPPLETLVDERL
jgi:signal transduction histidine kinase